MANIRPLSPGLQKISIELLNEEPEKISEQIAELREWIENQPHLSARTDDQFLLAFIRGCKHNMELSKKKIDQFYTLRTKDPELFFCTDIDEPKIKELKSLGIILYSLKAIGEDGPRLIIIRAGKYSCSKFTFADIVRLEELIQEISLWEDDNAIISGVIYLWDFANASFGHYSAITPTVMKKVTDFVQKGLPIRIKQTHFINTPRGFDTFFYVIKKLLSEERQNKISVHSNLTSLYDDIPKQWLPAEYGGDSGTVEDIKIYWMQRIESYREYFLQNENYKTDESLRPQPLENRPTAVIPEVIPEELRICSLVGVEQLSSNSEQICLQTEQQLFEKEEQIPPPEVEPLSTKQEMVLVTEDKEQKSSPYLEEEQSLCNEMECTQQLKDDEQKSSSETEDEHLLPEENKQMTSVEEEDWELDPSPEGNDQIESSLKQEGKELEFEQQMAPLEVEEREPNQLPYSSKQEGEKLEFEQEMSPLKVEEWGPNQLPSSSKQEREELEFEQEMGPREVKEREPNQLPSSSKQEREELEFEQEMGPREVKEWGPSQLRSSSKQEGKELEFEQQMTPLEVEERGSNQLSSEIEEETEQKAEEQLAESQEQIPLQEEPNRKENREHEDQTQLQEQKKSNFLHNITEDKT